MIVKILGNKGGGSARATMDYMLGKEKDREGAILLSGDPDLTAQLADNLEFQNRYTVGVLSFEEPNLKSDVKQKIMEDFEKTLLAGLERDEYDITWIEHTDKGRLELNFIIPNIELTTGKRLQPYYDKLDRPLVENWKQKTNFEYELSDPHAPEKAQAIKILNTQNLPKNVIEIKEKIGSIIANQIMNGIIQDRRGVLDTLEKSGFDVVRQTERSISIKNPNGQRNIRLEGTIYENRQFDQQFAEEHRKSGELYTRTNRIRYTEALRKLDSLVRKKQQANYERFTSQSRFDSTRKPENQRYNTLELIYRSSTRNIDYDINNSNRDELMVLSYVDQQKTRISRDQTTDSSNTSTSIAIGQSRNYSDSRQIVLDSGEKSKGFDCIRNGFEQSKSTNAKTKIENDYAQRLYESMQRIVSLIKEPNRGNGTAKLDSEQSDKIIRKSEQTIITASRSIEQSKSSIEQSKSSIERIRLVNKNLDIRNELSIEKKDRDTGFDMNM